MEQPQGRELSVLTAGGLHKMVFECPFQRHAVCDLWICECWGMVVVEEFRLVFSSFFPGFIVGSYLILQESHVCCAVCKHLIKARTCAWQLHWQICSNSSVLMPLPGNVSCFCCGRSPRKACMRSTSIAISFIPLKILKMNYLSKMLLSEVWTTDVFFNYSWLLGFFCSGAAHGELLEER